MNTIGVIGVGVVGGAVAEGFALSGLKVHTYDKYKPEHDSFPHIMTDTDAIFICVPTPTLSDDSQDITALVETFALLKAHQYKGIIVVKSTVLPGTTKRMAKTFGFTKVIHNPELLTAASPLQDFMNQVVVLLGSECQESLDSVGNMYSRIGFNNVMKYPQTCESELTKYQHNYHLSVKVGFCNDFYDVCEVLGASYDRVRYGTVAAGGMSLGHTTVPFKGTFGYDGMCFPKDTRAFLKWAKEELGLKVETLEGAVLGNRRRRSEVM